MDDIKLITRRQLGQPSEPSQPGNPSEFFGEQSNDIQLNKINDFDTLSGVEKLKQDINKIILTERGTHPTFELYGTILQSLIGSKNNFDFLKAKIKDEVIGALQVLQFINKENPNEDEQLETLELLRIQQLTTDQIEIQLSVITISGKRVSTGIVITP
jgi:phage baseplate assembly protein W